MSFIVQRANVEMNAPGQINTAALFLFPALLVTAVTSLPIYGLPITSLPPYYRWSCTYHYAPLRHPPPCCSQLAASCLFETLDTSHTFQLLRLRLLLQSIAAASQLPKVFLPEHIANPNKQQHTTACPCSFSSLHPPEMIIGIEYSRSR